MIYVLMGKSCSGKTTVMNRLVDMGYKKIKTYTTRPIREVEKELDEKYLDYIFTNLFDLAPIILNSYTLCFRIYNEWIYTLDVRDIENVGKDEEVFVILSPEGAKELKERFGDKVAIIYLNATDSTIRGRMSVRTKENEREAQRRFRADKADFKNAIYDYNININKETSIEDITTQIVTLMKFDRGN